MNNRALLLVLIACGLILSALITRNGGLLSLAIPFLVFLLVGLAGVPTDIRLEAGRSLDKPGVYAREAVEANIAVRNLGKTLRNVYLEDSLFPSMTLTDGQARKRLSLPAGESTTLRYRFQAGRGVYSWNTLRADAGDPLGLFEVPFELPAAGEILVRPAPLQIRPLMLKPLATLHITGPIPARQAGSGTDFWGTREYRAGDSLRQVNWRLAARHPHQIYTNEFEREEIGDFGLILDARRLTNTEAMEEVLFEHSVSAAAALSANFLRNGNRVSLLVLGKSVVSVFPGYGKKQINSLQRKLASVKLQGYLPFNHFEHFPTRLFPARSLVIVISPYDRRDLSTYGRLRAFSYDVLLISPDPVDLSTRMRPDNETNRLAARAARAERRIQLQRLSQLGVNVIDWQVDQPIETAIRKTARYLTHRRNL